MTKTNPREEVNTLLDRLGGWLIFLLSVFLIGGTVLYIVLRPSAPPVNEITITIVADSTGYVPSVVKYDIDSLSRLIKQQDSDIRERYAYMIEQKEHENTLFTLGSVLISIILAIFGFFGYRSFKSIEEKAVSNAREKASSKVNTEMVTMRKELERELRGVIDKTFLDEYENRLREKVESILNDVYNETISARLGAIQVSQEELNAIKERLTSVETFISALRDNGIKVTFDSVAGNKSDVEEFAEERKRTMGDDFSDNKEGGVQ